LKTLKTARAGYWLELAWIWDRRHVRLAPRNDAASDPRFAQRLAALEGEDLLGDAGGRVGENSPRNSIAGSIGSI
jgi:hypothetical protein